MIAANEQVGSRLTEEQNNRRQTSLADTQSEAASAGTRRRVESSSSLYSPANSGVVGNSPSSVRSIKRRDSNSILRESFLSALSGGECLLSQEEKSRDEDDEYTQHSPLDEWDEGRLLADLPTQLHPAVSMGIRQVSSGFFSSSRCSSEGSLAFLDAASEFHRTNSMAFLDAASDFHRTMSSAALSCRHFDETSTIDDHDAKGMSQDESIKLGLDGERNAMNELSTAAGQAAVRQFSWNAVDILYHDVMVHVFTFLDAKDLSAFSETARRPNFECFYYLQLLLQRALIISPESGAVPFGKMKTPGRHIHSVDVNCLATIAGSGSLSRLAAIDYPMAQVVVQEYLESNSTLRSMPFSHSLAYIRQVLIRSGFQGPQLPTSSSPSGAVARAAALVTMVGAASYVSGQADFDFTAIQQMLFRLGLAGSLFRAGVTATRQAKKRLTDGPLTDDPNSEDQGDAANANAPSETSIVHSNVMTFPPVPASFSQMLSMMRSMAEETLQRSTQEMRRLEQGGRTNEAQPQAAETQSPTAEAQPPTAETQSPTSNSQSPNTSTKSVRGKRVRARLDATPEEKTSLESDLADSVLYSPNPYEHVEETKSESEQDAVAKAKAARKMPSGCVGAYSRAVHKATSLLINDIKKRRRENFAALSMGEQMDIAAMFVDACTSDDTLHIAKELVQERNIIDVDGFYVGTDRTETCALHTAAFHGACKVVEFLCSGLDDSDPAKDGGMCDINLCDDNGWTAMHFAAGANSAEVIRILASHGAKTSVEAGNGYTPFHWAQRLSNEEAAQELERLGADVRFWSFAGNRHLPFSFLTRRFFSSAVAT